MYDPFLGQIQLFAFGFAPKGWIICKGATLYVREHRALFELLGNRFGGDGVNTFCLPNLTYAQPTGKPDQMCYYMAIMGVYPHEN
ncbi:Tail Collar domain protein [Desulfofarcimen acetoxidans DSM 771]|uniref:Tail Collar domain protein n=1 Tax=Desulfofarcimen acetoxidans (strain ATCC 49208 / DSM 771 / KCTC 5769 / VKM B-1644 / 5575) TaxID=485916 RepID=C8W2G5_DESAS|nr:tail fiber protein [Desulfofarcimen acetoxidans]ACV63649.1 Tail Collar domain protein [Desulfofarcimen acetoxidans DSM 771]